jgi:hypothetical protein
MPNSSHKDIPTFNLLSLGERGVGKTVFLAGSYAEFSSQISQDISWLLECQDSRDRENLESILNYITKTGEYPPPTMKIAAFDFSLKHRDRKGTRTVCHFRWWDIPGEYCDFQQPEFQEMVLNSHSCCIFIDAYRLLGDSNYLNGIESLINQVMAIANLVDFDTFPYSFALILTKCDRLEPGLISRLQIEEKLYILIASLEAASAKYRRFYASIPILESGDRFFLQATGAAEAFLWLASELEKTHKSHPNQTLASALNPPPAAEPTARSSNSVWLWLVAVCGLFGIVIAVWFAFISPNYKTPTPQITPSERQQ